MPPCTAQGHLARGDFQTHRGLGELREGGFWSVSSLWGEMSPFLSSFLFLQPQVHALAFPPALPYPPDPWGAWHWGSW